MLTFEITDVRQIWVRPLFASADVEGYRATITFSTGDVVNVSTLEGENVWCADSRFGANGYPYFSHGEGDRTCNKQIISDTALVRALDEATQTMMEEKGSADSEAAFQVWRDMNVFYEREEI